MALAISTTPNPYVAMWKIKFTKPENLTADNCYF